MWCLLIVLKWGWSFNAVGGLKLEHSISFLAFLGAMLTLNLLPVHELVPQVITALLLWCQVLNLGCLSSSLRHQSYSCMEQNNKS